MRREFGVRQEYLWRLNGSVSRGGKCMSAMLPLLLQPPPKSSSHWSWPTWLVIYKHCLLRCFTEMHTDKTEHSQFHSTTHWHNGLQIEHMHTELCFFKANFYRSQPGETVERHFYVSSGGLQKVLLNLTVLPPPRQTTENGTVISATTVDTWPDLCWSWTAHTWLLHLSTRSLSKPLWCWSRCHMLLGDKQATPQRDHSFLGSQTGSLVLQMNLSCMFLNTRKTFHLSGFCTCLTQVMRNILVLDQVSGYVGSAQ